MYLEKREKNQKIDFAKKRHVLGDGMLLYIKSYIVTYALSVLRSKPKIRVYSNAEYTLECVFFSLSLLVFIIMVYCYCYFHTHLNSCLAILTNMM